MKILAIRIKNLASLEGTTEIDFTGEPLCTAGIFAITGPTGAGKSTILDALCLALYAQTPRYNTSSDPNQSIQDISGNTITQSDPRKILRDGAAEGYAEVDFVGVDGNRYRAQWNVRRARNKADGALQSYQVACTNLDTNAAIQGTKTEVLTFVSQKVGLSFDQFTRAVLLAQGDFTAFLKAPNNEKADLLEKLTGTQVYSELSKHIYERHRTEKEELTLLTVQQEGISILKEDELEMIEVV
jgi:exonuclease SbcC